MLRVRLPGVAFAFALALAASLLSTLPALAANGLTALPLAIVLGMLAGHTLYPRLADRADAGVAWSKGTLLRAGIVLYGLKLTFQDIAAVGAPALATDALVLTSTLTLAVILGRKVFGLDRDSALLIGAGSSICGAAAVLATEPVLKADAAKVTVAVATVVIFGTTAMFLYPVLYHWQAPLLGLSPARFGVYTGATVHEVAQALAAGRAINETAAQMAVISKMLRVMMLAPFLILLSAWRARRADGAGAPRGRLALPWFALGFIAVAGLNSLGVVPAPLADALRTLDGLLLATAMAALGLTTHVSALRRAGLKPLLLAGCLFLHLIVNGALIDAACHRLFG